MRYKTDVTGDGLQDIMKYCIRDLDMVFQRYGEEMVITSTTEGKHSAGSLHYQGLAIDIRIRSLRTRNVEDIINDIKQKLSLMSDKFQVIRELTHIHVEYDRRC